MPDEHDAELLDAQMDTELLATGLHASSSWLERAMSGAGGNRVKDPAALAIATRKHYGRRESHGDDDRERHVTDPGELPFHHKHVTSRAARSESLTADTAVVDTSKLKVSTETSAGTKHGKRPGNLAVRTSPATPSGAPSPNSTSPSMLHVLARRQLVSRSFMPRASVAIGKISSRPEEHNVDYKSADERYNLNTRRADRVGEEDAGAGGGPLSIELSPSGAAQRGQELPSPQSGSDSLTVSDRDRESGEQSDGGPDGAHQKRIAGKGLTLDELIRLGPQNADGYQLTLQMMLHTYNRLV